MTQPTKSAEIHVPRARFRNLPTEIQVILWKEEFESLWLLAKLASNVRSLCELKHIIGTPDTFGGHEALSREFWIVALDVHEAVTGCKRNPNPFWIAVDEKPGVSMASIMHWQFDVGQGYRARRRDTFAVDTFRKVCNAVGLRLWYDHNQEDVQHTFTAVSSKAWYLVTIRNPHGTVRHFDECAAVSCEVRLYMLQHTPEVQQTLRDDLALCQELCDLTVRVQDDLFIAADAVDDAPPSAISEQWCCGRQVYTTLPHIRVVFEQTYPYPHPGGRDANVGFDPHACDDFNLMPWILGTLRNHLGLELTVVEES